MNWDWPENNKEKHQFRSYYCSQCHQNKPCSKLDREKQECCQCVYQKEREKAQEYSNYQQILKDGKIQQRILTITSEEDNS